MFLRLLALVHAPVERAEAEVAVANEGTHAVLRGQRHLSEGALSADPCSGGSRCAATSPSSLSANAS